MLHGRVKGMVGEQKKFYPIGVGKISDSRQIGNIRIKEEGIN